MSGAFDDQAYRLLLNRHIADIRGRQAWCLQLREERRDYALRSKASAELETAAQAFITDAIDFIGRHRKHAIAAAKVAQGKAAASPFDEQREASLAEALSLVENLARVEEGTAVTVLQPIIQAFREARAAYELTRQKHDLQYSPDFRGEHATSAAITRDEANIRAREALRNPKLRTVRKLAKAIGCSDGLISKLPAWQAYQNELKQRGAKKPRAPTAVGLTDAVLANSGRGDEELQRLLAEQSTDDEESRKRPHRRRKV